MSKTQKNMVLFLVSAMAGMMYLTPFLRFSYYDQMIEALHLTDVQLGTVSSFYGWFSLGLYIIGGYVADRFSTKSLVLFSGVGMFFTSLWYAMFPGFLALCLIHGLFGVFSVGIYWCAYIKAVRELGTPQEQGRLYGNSEAIRGVLQTVVSFLCLFLVNQFTEENAGFRYALLLNAAMFLILSVACLFVLPKEDKQQSEDVARQRDEDRQKGQVISLLKNPGVWICTIIVMAGFCVWETGNSYLGTFSSRVLHISDSLASTISIIRSNVIVILAGIIGGHLFDKFKTKGMGMMVFFSCVILSCFGVIFTTGVPMLCIVFTLIMMFFSNCAKAGYWSIADEAGVPREGAGLATGLISIVAYTPDIFIFIVVPKLLAIGEGQGNIATGFDYMLDWIISFAILGIAGGFFLRKRANDGYSINS